MMELVDVTDSKSVGLIPRVGSSPTTGTRESDLFLDGIWFSFFSGIELERGRVSYLCTYMWNTGISVKRGQALP